MAPAFDFDSGRPDRVDIFVLEDEDEVLQGLVLTTYDIFFKDQPDDLAAYLTSCLTVVAAPGQSTAWFGFEDSFTFDEVLTAVSARKTFALADFDGNISLALEDDELASISWAKRIERARYALLASRE